MKQYYCSSCHKPCDTYAIDEGIGDYEYWGSKETHSLWTRYSHCCTADVTTEPYYEDTSDDQ